MAIFHTGVSRNLRGHSCNGDRTVTNDGKLRRYAAAVLGISAQRRGKDANLEQLRHQRPAATVLPDTAGQLSR